jgi:isocitrate/isopropylmalate dehydrogenase
MTALQQVLKEGKAITRDIGGNASTTEMTDALLAAL